MAISQFFDDTRILISHLDQLHSELVRHSGLISRLAKKGINIPALEKDCAGIQDFGDPITWEEKGSKAREKASELISTLATFDDSWDRINTVLKKTGQCYGKFDESLSHADGDLRTDRGDFARSFTTECGQFLSTLVDPSQLKEPERASHWEEKALDLTLKGKRVASGDFVLPPPNQAETTKKPEPSIIEGKTKEEATPSLAIPPEGEFSENGEVLTWVFGEKRYQVPDSLKKPLKGYLEAIKAHRERRVRPWIVLEGELKNSYDLGTKLKNFIQKVKSFHPPVDCYPRVSKPKGSKNIEMHFDKAKDTNPRNSGRNSTSPNT